MKAIYIFTIEEQPDERDCIKRTINAGVPGDYSIVYKDIDISEYKNEDELCNYLFDEIESRRCNLIIVDYKLEKKNKRLDGSKIYSIISDRIQMFPIVVLTNMDGDCKEKNTLDPNRVYPKKYFFDALEERSIEMVKNLFLMISLYSRRLCEADEFENKILMSQERNISEIIEYNNKIIKLLPSANSLMPEGIADKAFFDELSASLEKAINYLEKHEKK